MTDVRVVQLDARAHDRSSFTSGRPSLDRYIRKQAGQEKRRKVTAVFVMTPVDEPSTIAGYYTLCAVGVDLEDVPEDIAKRLPHYPVVSATLLGRLAVALRFRGQGLGGVLLVDALKRAHLATSDVGSPMVVTDPLDEEAATFYEKYGFRRLEGMDRMFLTMATIELLMRRGGRD